MTRTKILLVDDEELIRGLDKVLFRRKAFHLLVARDGEEAWALVEREQPDLVFLDLEMAGLPGDHCCRQMKRDPHLREIPVILISPGGAEAAERCRKAGADFVLVRPIQRLRLAALLPRLFCLPHRREPRRTTGVRVRFGLDAGDFHSASTLNLGTGGALIRTHRLLPVETMILLEILLPGRSSPVTCRGRVAWLLRPAPGEPEEGGEMGIEFLDLAPTEKDLIRLSLENESLLASA